MQRNQQSQLIEESSWLSQAIMEIFNGDKLNVAALGNQVPQLHIHHIVRHMNDPAWPKPIWGLQKEIYYESTQIETLTARVNEKLQALTTQYCAQYSER